MMNKTTMLAVIVVSAATAVQAQSIRVNVPHAIEAGNEFAPAGEYEVRPVSPGTSVVYQFRHTTGEHQFLVPMSSRLGPKEGPNHVVLTCAAERCQVKEIWIGGYGAGRRVKPGGSEMKDLTVQVAALKR